MANFQRTAFIILAIAVVVGGVYYFTNRSTAPTPGIVSDIFVDPAGPDLVITDVREGQYGAEYIVTVQNIGQKPATKSFYVCEWEFDNAPNPNVCNNGQIANYDEGKMSTASLKPGGKLETVFTINHITSGRKLYFEVDQSNDPASDNTIMESNEKNNAYTFTKI